MEQHVRCALNALYEAERLRIADIVSDKTGDYSHPVFGDGAINARMMLIGEAPGREEAAAGRPFVGKAGATLSELLALADIERGGVFVTNAVKFRPTVVKPRTVSNRAPAKDEITAGLNVLDGELTLIAPRIVATLGNTPLKALALLGRIAPCTIGGRHGAAMRVAGADFILFPLYHPASAIYNPALLDDMKRDIIQLGGLYAAEKGDEPV